jgi:hypothetical protein
VRPRRERHGLRKEHVRGGHLLLQRQLRNLRADEWRVHAADLHREQLTGRAAPSYADAFAFNAA